MIRCASRLENCCSCDYVAVYDGPSVNSRPLGKLCNNTLNFFQSSSTYLTVLFRTDGSVTGRGFNAEFKSSLPPGAGQYRLQVNQHGRFMLFHMAKPDPTKSPGRPNPALHLSLAWKPIQTIAVIQNPLSKTKMQYQCQYDFSLYNIAL